MKDGIIARRDWLEADRDRAQAVVESLLEGWTQALKDQDETLALCQKIRPDMDAAHQAQQFKDIRSLILTRATLEQGLGYPKAEHVVRAARALREVEGREMKESAESFIASEFWDAAPRSLRSTSW